MVDQETEESLLKEYFADHDFREVINSNIGSDQKNMVDIKNHQLMLSKVFQSQGSYEGFFNYTGIRLLRSSP